MAAHDTRIARLSGIVLLSALWTACAGPRVSMPGSVSGGDTTIRVRVASRTVSVPLEEYVVGAALSEVSPVGESQATVARVFDVQTVLARTYALSHLRRHSREGFDLCDTTHCQVYQPARVTSSQFAAAAKAAAARSRGRILRHNGQVIDALFHADCGGHTTTPAAAWGGTNHPYLSARPDDVPGVRHRTWTFEASHAEWRTLLNGESRSSVGPVFTGLTITGRGPGDRVTTLRAEGTRPRDLSGEMLRAVVTAARGARSVMSTRFTLDRTDTGFRLTGSGFGHGVGLCQVGAMARARRGDSLQAILAHYYPGTSLK